MNRARMWHQVSQLVLPYRGGLILLVDRHCGSSSSSRSRLRNKNMIIHPLIRPTSTYLDSLSAPRLGISLASRLFIGNPRLRRLLFSLGRRKSLSVSTLFIFSQQLDRGLQ